MTGDLLLPPYDLPVNCYVTASDAASVPRIDYGFITTWLGHCLAAFSEYGLCWFEPVAQAGLPAALKRHWHPVQLLHNDAGVQDRFSAFLQHDGSPAIVHMTGTDFQLRVWQALLSIPAGTTATYGELAARLDGSRFARAVGAAVGKNYIAWFVPCHRVLPAAGGPGHYRWGRALKVSLLEAEAPAIAGL